MAIGCHRAAAGGEIVMSRWAVVGERPIGIDVQTLGELALDRDSEHVGAIVGVSAGRRIGPGHPAGRRDERIVMLPGIARRAERMR